MGKAEDLNALAARLNDAAEKGSQASPRDLAAAAAIIRATVVLEATLAMVVALEPES